MIWYTCCVKVIYYTRHARNRMRLYGVEREAVEAALTQPALRQPSERGKEHAWKTVGAGIVLRVTFVEEAARYVVITVTPKCTLPEVTS